MNSNPEILELEKVLKKLENLHASFDYLRISIASPQRIKTWAQRILPSGEIVGEILKPETINFRTHQPELNGLFCEKIFGPIKNWKCQCGKYNGFVLDKICEDCEVEITEARVRRYRMGYIELTSPIVHLWYAKGVPCYLLVLLSCFNDELTELELKIKDLEDVIYLRTSDSGYTMPSSRGKMPKYNILLDFVDVRANNKFNKFLKNKEKDEATILEKTNNSYHYGKPRINNYYYGRNYKIKRTGGEIIKAALESIDLKKQIEKDRSYINLTGIALLQDKNIPDRKLLPDKKIIRRIRILESFLSTKTDPSWMVLTTLPILPPNLRPLLELDNNKLVAADVNEIYRLIITRNQRLYDFTYNYITPELIIVHAKKLLQESIDSLIDNARVAKDRKFCLNNKPLKSLTEILEGKQGRFRQSLLGKRVDYSGRSVIIVGPHLRLNQCGLPYEMATELFQPLLINQLLKTKIKAPSHNTKLAHTIIKKNKPFVWSLLVSLTRKHCILLNRAPTLHRFGIQAFDPVMILGQAIHLHPLVCTGFNADFDGDQMAVHLPLYQSSQLEARTMMRPSYNVISPSNGDVILKPTQDMVIGCYYLTIMIKKYKDNVKKWFGNEDEALMAFYQKQLTIHTPILVRYSIANFEINIVDEKLKFVDTVTFLSNNEREIFVYKVFEIDISLQKYYLITNIGVLIARYVNENKY
jgi:DNA-directed RNA polymerase subunit beta'